MCSIICHDDRDESIITLDNPFSCCTCWTSGFTGIRCRIDSGCNYSEIPRRDAFVFGTYDSPFVFVTSNLSNVYFAGMAGEAGVFKSTDQYHFYVSRCDAL